ncbi:MAG: hypothetical protein ABW136_03015 [Steroidobacteraceae bacterium]
MLLPLLSAAPGAIGLAGIACLAIGYHAGIDAGAIAAALAFAVGGFLFLRAPDPATGHRRHLVLAVLLFTVHAVALYTFGSNGRDAVLPIGLQGTLAITAALLCATIAVRQTLRDTRGESRRAGSSTEDPENTLEIDAAETRSQPALVLPPPAPVRGLLIAGIVTTAAFVLATVYWLEDEGPQAHMAAAAAGERLSRAAPALPAPQVEPAEAVQPESGTSEIVEAPPPAPVPQMPAITPSDARRECMAQIETARLFLQLARSTPTQAGYASATGAHIERILKARPVGPRPLERIADRMWEQREAPERDASWWSGQYARCEAARSGGTWYVVRG